MQYLILLMCLTGCDLEPNAKRALESSGFIEIEIKEFSFATCGEGDLYSHKFTANNVHGTQVHGYICCGSFKGCTVRF